MAHFQKSGNLGQGWVSVQLLDRLGDTRAFFSNLCAPIILGFHPRDLSP